MAQIDNFRKVLGLPDPEGTPGPGSMQETPAVKEKNKTLLVKKSTHERLSAVLFWKRRTGTDEHPTMDRLIREMLDTYLTMNPEAKRFVEKDA